MFTQGVQKSAYTNNNVHLISEKEITRVTKIEIFHDHDGWASSDVYITLANGLKLTYTYPRDELFVSEGDNVELEFGPEKRTVTVRTVGTSVQFYQPSPDAILYLAGC
jgi:hypothetical protein